MPNRPRPDDIVYPATIPFALVHLACLGILWTGVSVKMLGLCAALYFVRMFAITAGNHRYFSHRTYKTSRLGQFLLAILCQTAAQRGILWWAAHHRMHHKHSDMPLDPHSPRMVGFWHAHIGWIFTRGSHDFDEAVVSDLTRYPELVWLNKYRYLPAAVLGLSVFLIGGWEALFVGFFLSTVLLYHATFAINSLAHVLGDQRYLTGDDSRNNWWLALLTLGEGWHNNHHHFQGSTRQGFLWWEIDVTFYILKVLSWVGVVRDLQSPPQDVVRGERRLARPTVERVAQELAATFEAARISRKVAAAWVSAHGTDGLMERVQERRNQIEVLIADMNLPEMPTQDELRRRAQQMYAQSPSLEAIAIRARQILVEAVSAELQKRTLVLGGGATS